MISSRDLDYIENRLLSPCMPASEAYSRLAKIDATLSCDLMDAMQVFTDECRRIRKELSDRYNAERYHTNMKGLKK